jgi:hypothetical protein
MYQALCKLDRAYSGQLRTALLMIKLSQWLNKMARTAQNVFEWAALYFTLI